MKGGQVVDFVMYRNRWVKEKFTDEPSEELKKAIQTLIQRLKNHDPLKPEWNLESTCR